MKKILALILALCCVLSMASCNLFGGDGDGGAKNKDGVEEFVKLYSVSAPTKVVMKKSTTLGGVTFTGGYTLLTGSINDGKTATVMTYRYELLQGVKKGAGDVIVPITGDPVEGSREYLEGKGERFDGGQWDKTGTNFAPKPGSIAINLDKAKLKDCVYSENGELKTLSFTVAAADTASVFGSEYGITSDATVVITANVALVTGITISYTEAIESEDDDIEYPVASVTISVVYSYGIEEITLVKQPQ